MMPSFSFGLSIIDSENISKSLKEAGQKMYATKRTLKNEAMLYPL